MSNAASDPLTTHALFAHDRVAAGYASARPVLHGEVFARVRELLGETARLGRGLDVGCGTGLSTMALLALTTDATGVDGALPMLRRATRREGVRYVAAWAEELPFAEQSFDLIVACGSIDWVDRARFVPRASELLAPGGWLVPLDFGDAGRSPDMPELGPWHAEVFQREFPPPPSRDPLVTAREASSADLTAPIHHDFALQCAFTAARYSDFLMTESSVIAAVEYGDRRPAEIRDWLVGELDPLFGGRRRRVTFGGYIQVLRKQR